jgi:hypothetical protein
VIPLLHPKGHMQAISSRQEQLECCRGLAVVLTRNNGAREVIEETASQLLTASRLQLFSNNR